MTNLDNILKRGGFYCGTDNGNDDKVIKNFPAFVGFYHSLLCIKASYSDDMKEAQKNQKSFGEEFLKFLK